MALGDVNTSPCFTRRRRATSDASISIQFSVYELDNTDHDGYAYHRSPAFAALKPVFTARVRSPTPSLGPICEHLNLVRPPSVECESNFAGIVWLVSSSRMVRVPSQT